MEHAIKLLDSAFAHNENAIKWNMEEAKRLSDQLSNILKDTRELNQEQIEINKARRILREAGE